MNFTEARLNWIEEASRKGLPAPSRDELAAFADGFKAATVVSSAAVSRSYVLEEAALECQRVADIGEGPNGVTRATALWLRDNIRAMKDQATTPSATASSMPPFEKANNTFNFKAGMGDQQVPVLEITFKPGDWEARDAFADFVEQHRTTKTATDSRAKG